MSSSAAGLEQYLEYAHDLNHDPVGIDEEFIAALENEALDFEQYNLVFYFHTEGSGSIKITPEQPVWKNRAKSKVLIKFRRLIPELQTSDMAYYAYIYKAKKEIEEVFIWPNDMDSVVIEIPSLF